MKLTRKQISGANRSAAIQTGTYAIPTHKVHKNKKAYDRKKIKKIRVGQS